MNSPAKNILVTGAAGFVGFHVAKRLLEKGRQVTGIDNLNEYYSLELKSERLEELKKLPGFSFIKQDLCDAPALHDLVDREKFDAVVHLAAQAGVRYSLENPAAYVDSNMVGTFNVLEACRRINVGHLVYASSSSVYGLNSAMPYAVHNNVDHPVSLYAATKKSGELMAHSYAHLFRFPITGLRFFTVYGPWGRPDMAYFKFARAIMLGEPLPLYAGGHLKRDYTYIDDIVSGVLAVIDHPATPDEEWSSENPNPASSTAPYRLYNIGAGKPQSTREMLALLEKELGREAIIEELPMQPGDVESTWADIESLKRDVGYEPTTELRDGLREFVSWFRKHYLDSGRDIPKA